MDWFSRLADWANQNEGLLQVLAMLGGVGALLISLRRQRAGASAKAFAQEPVPAKLVVRPTPEDRATLIATIRGFGGQTDGEGDEVIAVFADADEAARAALKVRATLAPKRVGATEFLVCEQTAPIPEPSDENRGVVRVTSALRRALLDATDLRVVERGPGAVPYVVSETTPFDSIRPWALPLVGMALAVAGLIWFLTPATPTVSGLSGRPAIAVLPFDDFSEDGAKRMFAAGLGEDLIMRLASWRMFPVISRISSFNRELPEDVQVVGEELGARYVVEGSVREAEDQVRVVVQLIDATTGRHVWAEQYDRAFSDIFALQDEISSAIVGAMNPALLKFETERAVQKEAENLDAWSAAMRGWWHFDQFTREDMRKAQELFAHATELDPQWGYGFAGLALSHFYELSYGWADSAEASVKILVEAAERAVALDPLGADAHHALGHAYSVTRQTDRMMDIFREGVELNPSHHLANNCYGYHLAWTGHPEKAKKHIARAMVLSPRDAYGFAPRLAMSWAHFSAGEYDEALEWAEKSIQRAPKVPWAYSVAAASAAHLGKVDHAQKIFQKGERLTPMSAQYFNGLYGVATPDFQARMKDGLQKAGWEKAAGQASS